MLNIHQLSISFDKKTILSDISFKLQKGQIACLLGASGCGKTTLLRCIAGFETPDTGSITLDGQALFDGKGAMPAHRRHIGMVFQDYALFPHLTVADNIAFGLSNMDKSAQAARVDEMLSLIDMQSYKNSYPHELSGGQQQRVALVRALAPRPSLVLLDEPFSNLDVELRTSLSKEVRRLLTSQNVSAIMVTHDQAEAFAMADVVGMIADGKLQQWDTPTALYHTPATETVARFIGEGVLIDIQHGGEHGFDSIFGRINLPVPPHATKALIRPHDVKPYKADRDTHAIDATVSDRDFRGGNWLYTLSTNTGQTLLMQSSLAANHDSHQIGDRLTVAIRRVSTL